MNPQNQSVLDSDVVTPKIKEWILRGETNTWILNHLEEEFDIFTTKDSLRRFRVRHELQIPGTERAYTRIQGDEAEILTEPSTKKILDDPDTMLEQRGLKPEDWVISSLLSNEWDAPVKGGNKVKMYQTKFSVQRRKPEATLLPARSDGWIAPLASIDNAPRQSDKNYRLVVIIGDHQAPFYDSGLHDAFISWLEDNEPDEGVHLGDLMDFPDISRHKPDPENVAKANECIQAGYDILRSARHASPSTKWKFMPGNHDIRIRDYEAERAPGIYGLERASTPEVQGEVAHALPHLLRLDELGIEYVDPHGPYEDGQVTLSQHLAVFHGWKASQGSGKTALDTLKQTGFSIVIGHTHRQSIVHHTTHDINREITTLLACEAGCMCQVNNRVQPDGRRFPSFTQMPDWQQGFTVATIWDDGKFAIDLAKYVNGVLLYRDQRYE